MNGLILQVVGGILAAFSTLALLWLARSWNRRRKAVYSRCAARYGRKLFLFAYPGQSETTDFPQTPTAEEVPFDPQKRMDEFSMLARTAEVQNLRRQQIEWEEANRRLEEFYKKSKAAPPETKLTNEVWERLIQALEKRKELEEAVRKLKEARNASGLGETELNRIAEELEKAIEQKNLLSAFSFDELPYAWPDEFDPLLHSGKRSDVFLASHVRTGKEVVIKLDRSGNVDKEQLQKVMLILSDLKHSLIPSIYDYFKPADDAGRPFCAVMEFIKGETLLESLVNNANVKPWQCLNWAYDLLDALEALHEKRVLHGDIQPSNLILSSDGSLRLIDFNKAVVVGPEETMDASLDLYQLGALMFRLLAKRAFRENESSEERKASLLENGVSEPLAEIILKATDENAENRYQSADEMRSALREMAKNDAEIKRNEKKMRTFLICSTLGLVIGISCVLIGQYVRNVQEHQLRRMEEMRVEAYKASDAFADGDYSQALEHALNAVTQKPDDPPVPAEAESVLAEILGVYDVFSGYKPEYSIGDDILSGRPVKAAVSPDGKRVAVMMVENFDSNASPVFPLRFFDAQSGKEIAQSVRMYPSALSEFKFLDDNILIYAGEQDLTVCSLPETLLDGEVLPAVTVLDKGVSATGIAVSGDGSVVAGVKRDGGIAVLYHIVRDGDAVRLEDEAFLPFLNGKSQYALPHDTFTDPLDNLFELDEHGKRLALNFSDNSLYIVDISAFSSLNSGFSHWIQRIQPEIYHEISLPSKRYEHFEGGFHGDFFLYSASTKSLRQDAIVSYAQVIRADTDAMEAVTGLSMTEEAPFRAHAYADADAAYLTVGSSLRRVDFLSETWETVDYADANITLLRRADGRVLIVTANHTVSVYDELEGKRVVSSGTPYDIAAFTQETLLLASQNRTTLSLLRWKECQPVLRYDPAFEHLYAAVQPDLSSSILYWPRMCKAFSSAGYPMGNQEFKDWDTELVKQSYQRDPDGDKLALIYEHRIDYYSAKDAKFLGSETAETPRNASDTDTMGDYFIESRPNDFTLIRNNSTEKEVTIKREILQNAFAQGENLLVSILTMDGTRYGLLLNPECKTVARLPNLCDVLPDGTLIFDDNHGKLFSAPLYSTDDLIRLSSDRRNEQA